MANRCKKFFLLFWAVSFCWLSFLTINAFDPLPPENVFFSGVDPNTGEVLWDCYNRDEAPNEYLHLIGEKYLTRKDGVLRNIFPEDFEIDFDYSNPTSENRLVHIPSKKRYPIADGFNLGLSGYCITPNKDWLIAVNEGILAAFSFKVPEGDTWKPAWKVFRKNMLCTQKRMISK